MFNTLDKTVFTQIKQHCYCLMDTKFQLCKMERVLEVKGGVETVAKEKAWEYQCGLETWKNAFSVEGSSGVWDYKLTVTSTLGTGQSFLLLGFSSCVQRQIKKISACVQESFPREASKCSTVKEMKIVYGQRNPLKWASRIKAIERK